MRSEADTRRAYLAFLIGVALLRNPALDFVAIDEDLHGLSHFYKLLLLLLLDMLVNVVEESL